jgi:FixJ family two-component response regulator
MTKPVDFDKLLGHIKTVIDRSWKRRALAAVRERLQTCLADLEMMQAKAIPRGRAGIGCR